jgi:hypothetical protein
MAYNDQPKRSNMPTDGVTDDASLFAEGKTFISAPQRWASGNLPDQPADNEADALDGNPDPWSGLHSGR